MESSMTGDLTLSYVITVTYRNGSELTITKPTEKSALAFCNEEIMWENTLKVVCPAIEFEEDGSFV